MNKATEMQNWLAAARKGDTFVYHTGLLAADREDPTSRGGAANEVANLAYSLYQLKTVALVQRRAGYGSCDYLAVKQ